MARQNTDRNEDRSAREEAQDIVDKEFAGLTDDAVTGDEETDEGLVGGEPLDDDEDLDEDEDLDDEDEEDLDDEDLDDDVDDEEEHLADDDEGAPDGVDRGDGRDVKGKFAGTAKDGAKDGAKDTGSTATTEKPVDQQAAAAGAAAGAAAAADTQPKWEPLKVRADKEDVGIGEAQMTRAAGHVMIGIKEEDFPRFQARLSRGVVAEKVWQRITQRERELEAEKAAPARKSDTEIEAEMTLDVLKPHLAEILTPLEMENLELRIKHAQREYATTYAGERENHMKEALRTTTPEQDEEAEAQQGLAGHLIAFREQPELADLTDDELRQAYRELSAVRRAVFWKEGDGFYANNQHIAQTLVRIKKSRTANPSETGAPPANGNTATTAENQPAAATDRSAQGERFNRGAETGVRDGKPGKSTSLRNNRGQDGARSRDERNTRERRRDRERENVKSPELAAEEEWRRAQRKLLSSDSLDFDTESED